MELEEDGPGGKLLVFKKENKRKIEEANTKVTATTHLNRFLYLLQQKGRAIFGRWLLYWNHKVMGASLVFT